MAEMTRAATLWAAAREDRWTLTGSGLFRDACERFAGRRGAPIREGKKRKVETVRHAGYEGTWVGWGLQVFREG